MQGFEKLGVKGIILDMDGVLWKLDTPIVDLANLFPQFLTHQLKVVLATNNGTSTVDQYVGKLAKFGVQIEAWQIVTSTMATAHLLKKDFPDAGAVHILGEKALYDTLADYGFYHSDEKPQAVVAGLSRDLSYSLLKDASILIQKGLPFYFTNPDPTYPTPEGNFPGAGTVLAALEAASGTKAKLAGKPNPFLFEVALARLGTEPFETLVVGDRLDTDILGGQRIGCRTALVLSGISQRSDLENWSPKPDLIIEKVSDVFADIE